MMKRCLIRPADLSDLDIICDLVLEFHAFHARHLQDHLNTLDTLSLSELGELQKRIKDIILEPESTILLAIESDRVVGFAELYLKHPDTTNRAVVPKLYGHLQSLVVSEGFRRQGTGDQLLQAAEDWARSRGAVELRLDIWEFPAGPLDFYKKQGYRTIRRTLAKDI